MNTGVNEMDSIIVVSIVDLFKLMFPEGKKDTACKDFFMSNLVL